MQAAHIAQVCGPKETKHLRRLMMEPEQNDGLIIVPPESLVDPGRQPLERLIEFLVSLDLGAAWLRQLCEAETSAEFRVPLQQAFCRQQSLLYALGVIEAVHSHA